MLETAFDKNVDHAARRIEQADQRVRSLNAARIAVRILVERTGATINGIPLEELVARELNLADPDRIAATRTVHELLAGAIEPMELAEQAQREQQVRAMELLPPQFIGVKAELLPRLPGETQIH